MPWDSDAAREAQKKGAEARRRRKNPNLRAKMVLLEGVTSAAQAVSDLAAGKNGFEDAKPELRFHAARVILEYVLGKPAGLEGEDEKKAEEAPADLFAALLKAPEDEEE